MASVKIRRKKLSDGRTSLYLDVNVGGRRKWEALGLFLVPEVAPNRGVNAQTMRLAEEMRRQREVQISAERFNIIDDSNKIDLVAFAESIGENKSEAWRRSTKVATTHLRDVGVFYIQDVNDRKMIQYMDYLRAEGKSDNTIRTYTLCVKALLTQARLRRYTSYMPNFENVRVKKNIRSYLTIDEQRKMAECVNMDNEIERAFLFSCMTGLRISDIAKMSFKDIYEVNGGKHRLLYRMEKTKQQEWIDLTDEAMAILNAVKCRRTRCFRLEHYERTQASKTIRAWAQRAGIPKYLTFHSARHTFAVTLLSNGVDIYTVSKLMGHSNIQTTEIYADIVDAHREQAIAQLPKILVEPKKKRK